MRSLEIITTQNVTIEYPLAGIRDRFSSFVIDFMFIWALSIILYFVSLIFIPKDLYSIAVYFTVLPVCIFYTLFSEIFGNGSSWGKKIIGLKVVKINGNEINLLDYIARWAFRIIDIYFSIGAVGMFLISSTNRSQRLGDIIANTTVIKIKPSGSPNLKQIEKLRSLDDYTPTYLQVKTMKEGEMITIKSALDEARKYPNKSHAYVISELTEIVCERLKINIPEENEMEFLQTIINDYIVLTR